MSRAKNTLDLSGSISVLKRMNPRDRDSEGNDLHHSSAGVRRGQGGGGCHRPSLSRASGNTGLIFLPVSLSVALSVNRINLNLLYFPVREKATS